MAGRQHRIAIQFRRPIRFKVCFTANCGHAITYKHSHSDQSEPSFAWRCQHICACTVEREPRIQPKFTRLFSYFWGWDLGTRLTPSCLRILAMCHGGARIYCTGHRRRNWRGGPGGPWPPLPPPPPPHFFRLIHPLLPCAKQKQ